MSKEPIRGEPMAGPSPLDPKRLRYVSPTLFVNEPPWKVVAVSVAGTSHAKTEKPCQDAAYCRILNGLLIGAVADGAGSARLGDEGAQLAVRKGVDTLADAVDRATASGQKLSAQLTAEHWHQMLRTAMHVALANILVRATLLSAEARDLATTLLLFAATSNRIIAAQIGDGAVVVRDDRGKMHALTTPQSGEYANATTFLVSPDAFKTVQHQVWQGQYTGIAAFTDGLQRLALSMPKGDPHAPFFAPLFDFAEGASNGKAAIKEIEGLLRSDKVTERADDDLTLMVARRTA